MDCKFDSIPWCHPDDAPSYNYPTDFSYCNQSIIFPLKQQSKIADE